MTIASADASGPTILVPSGRRRRLYGVAINTGFGRPDADLRGPVTDKATGTAWAEGRGYDSIRYLTDSDADLPNVIDFFAEAADHTSPGDALIVHISSHGALTKEGRAVICLAGCLTAPNFDAACLSGARFRDFAGSIPAGAFTAAILDICHADGARGMNPHGPYMRPRFLPHPDKHRAAMQADAAEDNYAGTVNAFSHFGMVHDVRGGIIFDELLWDVLLPACGRLETAADAFRNGRYCGAWSDALFPHLDGQPVRDAVAMATATLRAEGYTQTPGIDGGEYHRGRLLP